ncbi:SsgA family sporulation/cell division regulator [Nocardiopsis sp. HNM0947]|uniref:SsgA family sporulation/cell division regulator n=1 Tax=Nocardiopsis coralli TaxID=2772213 RepID=A0ABR9P4F3_9ACTN|nr:SsgA family sporulation/cell division regulator [Nocardiopsis coralli]MBE2998724.1 SsgA family sporulation/cell division regulator [Nocardiopsis coralli]
MTVTHPTQWLGVGGRTEHADLLDQIPHDLVLTWDGEVSYSVEIRFVLDPEEPEAYLCWEVDRDVLARGTASWAGDGDFRIAVWAQDPALVVINLFDAVTGRWSRYLARRGELEDFLAETYRQVPSGEEQLSLERVLAALIGGER